MCRGKGGFGGVREEASLRGREVGKVYIQEDAQVLHSP
jgi:hypothetical protein